METGLLTGQKHAFKFQPFGGVQRHDGDFVFIVVVATMTKEICSR